MESLGLSEGQDLLMLELRLSEMQGAQTHQQDVLWAHAAQEQAEAQSRARAQRRAEALEAENARASANLHAEMRRSAMARSRLRWAADAVRRRLGRRAASVAVPRPSVAPTTAPQATAPRVRTDAERDARDAHAEVGI